MMSNAHIEHWNVLLLSTLGRFASCKDSSGYVNMAPAKISDNSKDMRRIFLRFIIWILQERLVHQRYADDVVLFDFHGLMESVKSKIADLGFELTTYLELQKYR